MKKSKLNPIQIDTIKKTIECWIEDNSQEDMDKYTITVEHISNIFQVTKRLAYTILKEVQETKTIRYFNKRLFCENDSYVNAKLLIKYSKKVWMVAVDVQDLKEGTLKQECKNGTVFIEGNNVRDFVKKDAEVDLLRGYWEDVYE